MAEMKQVSDEIKKIDDNLKEINEKFQTFLQWVPNLPHSTTPIGKSAEDNVESRKWPPEEFSFRS